MDIHVGLIAGRHDLPVDEFIFGEIEDVMDFGAMNARVENWLMRYMIMNDDKRFDVFVYVTGLTAAMLSVVHVVDQLNNSGYHINLHAVHYNKETGSYVLQDVTERC